MTPKGRRLRMVSLYKKHVDYIEKTCLNFSKFARIMLEKRMRKTEHKIVNNLVNNSKKELLEVVPKTAKN